MSSRTLPGLLSARERVVIAVLARGLKDRGAFAAGRQEGGYQRADVLGEAAAERIVKRLHAQLGAPPLFDAWLIRYPVGASIAAHTDPALDGMCHVRLNALALGGGSGGVLYLDGAEVPLDDGDGVLFRPDLVRHQVTEVVGNERLLLSVGANVLADEAARLFD